MTTTTTPQYVSPCRGCEAEHHAEPAHLDRWSNRQLYAVVCPVDGLTDYVTAELLRAAPETPALNLTLTLKS